MELTIKEMKEIKTGKELKEKLTKEEIEILEVKGYKTDLDYELLRRLLNNITAETKKEYIELKYKIIDILMLILEE